MKFYDKFLNLFGKECVVSDEIKLDKKFKHTIEIVVDRIIVKPGQGSRISEAVELAMKEGEGLVTVHFKDKDFEKEQVFSTKLACPEHGVSIEELEPRMFSFNSPFGACPSCNGLGFTEKIDPNKIIKTDKSVIKGALGTIFASMEFSGFYRQMIDALAKEHGVDLTAGFQDGILHQRDIHDAVIAQLLGELIQRKAVFFHLGLIDYAVFDEEAGSAEKQAAQLDAFHGGAGQQHFAAKQDDDGQKAV